MESTRCLSSTNLSHSLALSSTKRSNPSRATSHVARTRVLALRREPHDRDFFCNGRFVDENMIVLRKRIHEMKMIERNYETPSDWTEGEKELFSGYGAFICEVFGALQSQLMSTRPSLAIGMVALVTLSVPTAAAFIFLHLMAAIHFG
ncbi:hypothetical protein Nepgr_028085 [Nepenthes gracilis]|uniref:Uncharacterized protein n=1 Tax=Nepenthes gracilis TaxID=150966 RepID=A0AAD3TBA6_NEPGR|nr:hypothetical protein Nepgr_028085 [Nepenthes gracilis]